MHVFLLVFTMSFTWSIFLIFISLQLATYSFQPKYLGRYQFGFELEQTANSSCFFDLQGQNVTEVVVTNASGLIDCGSVGAVYVFWFQCTYFFSQPCTSGNPCARFKDIKFISYCQVNVCCNVIVYFAEKDENAH